MPLRSAVAPTRFAIAPSHPPRYTINGITYDETYALLPGAEVKVYETATDMLRADAISDAAGNYTVDVNGDRAYYAVGYKAGSPDVAGTTLNTLTGGDAS